MTLYPKIFLVLLISVYIPVVLLGIAAYNRFSDQIEKATLAFLSDNLENNALRLQELFAEVEQRSVEIYSSKTLQDLLKASNANELDEIEYIREVDKLRYELAGKYDLNIYPIARDQYQNYNSLRLNVPKMDTGWFERALQSNGRGFWMQETATDFGVLSYDFYFIRPIRTLTPGFENLGVMLLRVPSVQVQRELIRTEQYPNYKLTVIDGQGVNLLSDDVLVFGSSTFSDTRALGYNDWQVAATMPLSDVTGKVEQIRAFTLVALLASLAVITILLAIITNNIVHPIKNIVGYMRRAQQGLLDTYSKYAARKDEVGQLSRGYNAMIGGLREWMEATKSAEEEKRKLELQMLMHQINPHFLYNTLDAIKWKAESAQQSDIAGMVNSLANLLRFSLNDGEKMTTLERELEHVKSYVNIEMMRKGHFRVFYHVQPAIMNVPYMKLVLQPIVENAVRYAMARVPDGEGKIMITMYREGKDILCRVEDNGPGCEEELLRRLNAGEAPVAASDAAAVGSGSGLGLRNTNRRLQVSFGPAYGIHLENQASSGLRVTIRHPDLSEG